MKESSNPLAREPHSLAPNAIIDRVQDANHRHLIKFLRESRGVPRRRSNLSSVYSRCKLVPVLSIARLGDNAVRHFRDLCETRRWQACQEKDHSRSAVVIKWKSQMLRSKSLAAKSFDRSAHLISVNAIAPPRASSRALRGSCVQEGSFRSY